MAAQLCEYVKNDCIVHFKRVSLLWPVWLSSEREAMGHCHYTVETVLKSKAFSTGTRNPIPMASTLWETPNFSVKSGLSTHTHKKTRSQLRSLPIPSGITENKKGAGPRRAGPLLRKPGSCPGLSLRQEGGSCCGASSRPLWHTRLEGRTAGGPGRVLAACPQ